MMRGIYPHGSWPSSLDARDVATASTRLGAARKNAAGDIVWWEGRPEEGGRGVIVAQSVSGERRDVTPEASNVRSRVHEYDGGSWTLLEDGRVAYVEGSDQNIHLVDASGNDTPLTTGDDSVRFGDLTSAGRHLMAVRETHGGSEPVNELVAIELDTGQQIVLAAGGDFYSSPRPHPADDRVAYICWDHPNMPWDTTELHVLRFDGSNVSDDSVVHAGAATQQPVWLDEGLLAITDITGWWLPYLFPDGTEPICVVDRNLEIELGSPPWVFAHHTLAGRSTSSLTGVAVIEGVDRLVRIANGQVTPIDSERNQWGPIWANDDGTITAAAASPLHPSEIIEVDAAGDEAVIRPAKDVQPPADVSAAEHISFDSADGRKAHALFYPPTSSVAAAPEGELPPLLVLSHGGPTAAAGAGYSPAIQYWTQRGFAVVDVNYGGSTGYGTAYRRLLNDSWGIVDVEDCIAAARHLAAAGLVDGDRTTIKGGSAGGFTTLAALTFADEFAAGASRYGIGDLETLARDTHKFESRYLDNLVGPYPEQRDVYVERSPINHTERLSAPMIVLQGADDPVVPPNQAEAMVEALLERSIPHAYLLFEGESHGFRDADNIATALEAEYVFFCRVFGIEPAGTSIDLDIVGLD